MVAKKTVCNMSHKQFVEHAKPLEVTIGNQKFNAAVKEFSTGSLGWYLNGKMPVTIDGVEITVQIGMNLTIVGSKELPKSHAHKAVEPAAHSHAHAGVGHTSGVSAQEPAESD